MLRWHAIAIESRQKVVLCINGTIWCHWGEFALATLSPIQLVLLHMGLP
jgi:hypothetical protein